MRLDHLLSKEEEVEERKVLFSYEGLSGAKRRENFKKISGGDAFRGHTRTHPEHDG